MAGRVSQASGTSLLNAKHHFPAEKNSLLLFMKWKEFGLVRAPCFMPACYTLQLFKNFTTSL
jgi:hypothetical protein